MKHRVVIIGSGPAGLTAALYTARANLNPVVYHGPLPGGQLTTTTEVENFPGFPKGILGPELMEQMTAQAARFGATLVESPVTKVDLAGRPLRAWIGEDLVEADAVIIATGAKPRTLGLANEKELLGYGLSTCATCDGAFFRDQEIVVVGGGDSACEEALFLSRFGSRVRLIHRRDALRASKIMAERVLSHPKVEVIWNSVVNALLGQRPSGLTGCVLKDVVAGKETEIECAAVFYAIGHIPNSELFKGQLELDQTGYIVTSPRSTRTSIPGVFACGDVQDSIYRQAVTAAGSGCMAAIEVERFLVD